MSSSPFVRGAVLKCRFPYDSHPNQPGPRPHYCLSVTQFESSGTLYAAVCYGTSKLDEPLLRKHAGMILSVPSSFIRGEMPGPVTHFIGDHIAFVPYNSKWFYMDFQARLDYVREKDRQGDFKRQRLYQDFVRFEEIMAASVGQDVDFWAQNENRQVLGLPPGKKLR
ncbi:hypothetical protein [Burkholderia anthina]|uniref:hypothetical protein n=1 Tax=Burkholderia anthina TaxID=179879 RepID=UPI0037C0C4D0